MRSHPALKKSGAFGGRFRVTHEVGTSPSSRASRRLGLETWRIRFRRLSGRRWRLVWEVRWTKLGSVGRGGCREMAMLWSEFGPVFGRWVRILAEIGCRRSRALAADGRLTATSAAKRPSKRFFPGRKRTAESRDTRDPPPRIARPSLGFPAGEPSWEPAQHLGGGKTFETHFCWPKTDQRKPRYGPPLLWGFQSLHWVFRPTNLHLHKPIASAAARPSKRFFTGRKRTS